MTLNVASGQPGPMMSGEFVSQSQPPAVIFRVKDLEPPSALYIQRDDEFVLSVSNTLGAGSAVSVLARMMLPNGVIQPILRQFVTANADATPELLPFALTEGFLLSATINSNGTNAPGLMYVRLWVNRGKVSVLPRNSVEVLIAGYALQDTPLGWPYGVQQNSLAGMGALLQGNSGNPAAGTDFSIGATVFTRRRISSITATLTTSAAVANRGVQVQIKQGATVLYMGPPNQTIPASTVATVSFSTASVQAAAVPTMVTVPLPQPATIAGNESVVIITNNLQAGDQWTNIAFLLEQWIDAA